MASSSSASPPAPTFSSLVYKYHVFLSFRGEDTRKTFVDHLYTALVQQGIYTYKDDETLDRGESIGPSLTAAIEESQMAVIIFSKNYANSSWCLDELVHIMKCKDIRGQIVMPVFYGVDPSEVRKQKRKYGEAFLIHELENKDKVESWRKALVDASNISGWETEHIANGHESKCIKEIVDTISHRLHPVMSSVDDNLVGLEARMQDLISKLQIGFGGKRMIGIWGVGGGGKTTLASCIYDEISSKFDGICFIKNIREQASKNGLEILQEKILCGVLKQKKAEVERVEEGRRMIKDRLHHRKVLIVLDDVDDLEHLEELAGSHDWFGEGSRIVITTRDEHVLTAHKVDLIHNISLLNYDEAMKLFCKHVPRDYRRIEDYEQLSKEVVSYAGGLPLALRVLGRFLCDKDINEWRSALARLKEIPNANILEKLKISFDGLTRLERGLFLDIACFFRRTSWWYTNVHIMMILDACGFHPVVGIKVLVQKALITISSNGRLDMHDLVQELALYIVRGEHPKNPEKHNRVWKREDFLTILAMNAKTNLDDIEAIDGQWFRSDESQNVLQVVSNMKKLRWISLYFHWLDAPSDEITLQPMPENFPPRELCCLTLNGLNAKQLWESYKFLPNMRMIKLDAMYNLVKTPDFSGLPNLRSFIIVHSPYLEEIHPSFGHLEKLVCVAIGDCGNLKMLPTITRSKKLETFVLSNCELVFNLSKIQQNMENLLPDNMSHTALWFFSEGLRKLHLNRCNLAEGDIRSAAVALPNLQELHLTENRFVRLNFGLLRLPRLKWLDISHCKHLVELLELPSTIAVIIADGCTSLESFGDVPICKWLWKVSLQGENKLGLHGGDMLLHSMLEGNAKDYFISICLSVIDIWRGFVLWLNWVNTYYMPLPYDWYNDFCGILMFFKFKSIYLYPVITIKLGVDVNFQCEVGQESNETLETHDHTYVGYVSFSSLRHTGCLNSTNNLISFSLNHENSYAVGNGFRAVLVPRKSKDDTMQTTELTIDYSEFWNEKEVHDGMTFTIQCDSNSPTEILPRFYGNL